MDLWCLLLIIFGSVALLVLLTIVLYKHFFKRFWDIALSGIALIILSPIFIILTLIGAIVMKGNPFFTQERPGKNEKIFKLVKFRSMTNKKDENGNLLPDNKRMTKYGKILRATSLDELPQLLNIFIGDMSIIGPRPLLVKYLPRYNEEQRHRHDVRPGLTGYAQVHGRNSLSWEEKFKLDVYYVNHISFLSDLKIVFGTVLCVFRRSGISSNTSVTMEEFLGNGEPNNE